MQTLYFLAVILCLSAFWCASKAQEGFDYDGPSDPYDGDVPDPYSADPYAEEDKAIPPRQLSSLEEIDAFLNEGGFEPMVMGFFDAETNGEDLEAYKFLAENEGRNFLFAFTTEKSVLEAKKYDGCAVIVYPPPKFINEKFERSKYRFPAKSLMKSPVNALLHFILAKSIPLVGEYTPSSETRYVFQNKPIVTVFTKVDHERNAKGYNYLASRVRKIAVQYKGKYIFTIADIETRFREIVDDYDISLPETKKTYVGLKDRDTYYHMSETFSLDNLGEFMKKFAAGNLEGKVKSSSPKGGSDEEGGEFYEGTDVTVLTKQNFDAEVTSSPADVLVEFYAPWCGHCKHLKPEFIGAAKHFTQDSGVKLAAMDATAHDVPAGYSVEGYPTLFFVPAHSKKPVPYDGPREAQGIIDYLKEHRTTAITTSSSEL